MRACEVRLTKAKNRVLLTGLFGLLSWPLNTRWRQVSPTQGMYGNPSQRVIDDGASYLVPKQSG